MCAALLYKSYSSVLHSNLKVISAAVAEQRIFKLYIGVQYSTILLCSSTVEQYRSTAVQYEIRLRMICRCLVLCRSSTAVQSSVQYKYNTVL